MTPRTSIIMPVYNTGSRVVGAIESVLDQTDPDFELLVLVDASPDDASARIAEYLKRHPDDRVRVFDNAKNQGVSGVRNQGLDEARGEWIAFLDSDDRFRPNFLSTMHAFAADNDADVAVCGHSLVHTDGKTRDRFRFRSGVRTGQEVALELLQDRVTPYVWDKLIRADLLGDLRFPRDIHRAEDAVFSLGAYSRADRVVLILSALYEYAVDAGSATWGKVTPIHESLKLMEHLGDAAGEITETPEGRHSYDVSWVLTFLNNAQQGLVTGGQSGDRAVRESRDQVSWRRIANSFRFQPVFGAAALLLKVSPAAYKLLYGAYVKRAYGL